MRADRNRVVLDFKRVVIKEYFDFLNAPRAPIIDKDNDQDLVLMVNQCTDSTDHDSSEDEKVKDSRQVKSIKSFLNEYNRQRSQEHQLHHGCVFKWLKAYYRGELEAWGGLNDLSKANCKAQQIMEHIYHEMKKRDPETAKWNKIVRKSRLSPDKYGVVAKKFIPRGTFLGFFKGEFVTEMVTPLDGFHKYLVDLESSTNEPYSYIDGSSFLSCFARYYAWSGSPAVQNVSVHRLMNWTDPNRRVGFMANKDIPKGEELVIPHNQDYWRRKHKHSQVESCSDNELLAQEKGDLFDN
jgi:hypothetical protein